MNEFLKIGDQLWMHAHGRTFTIPLNEESQTGSQRSRAKTVNDSGLLVSPMPGKILQIPVKSGDAVNAGKTVCVIEAMKMEYALKAPFDGKVKNIYKKAGDLVQLDEKIVEIERNPS